MTDTHAAEAPAEPAPEAAAEVETAPAEAPAERTLPNVEHLGVLRRSVLDHLVDTEGPQSVALILAAMPPGTTRGSGESAIKREFDAGRIERVSPGVYKLAPPKLPEAKPTPQPPPTPTEEATWFAALDGWINDPETWDRERFGPRPDEPGRRIPAGVVAKGVDRNRKRLERQRDREATLARQAAADQELRTKLLHACNGNYSSSLATDDLSSIKSVLEIVPIDRVLTTIRCKVDKRSYPANPTLLSWSDPVLLKEIAENYCRTMIVPRLVDAWSKAGTAPATKARESSPPAAPMADIDELRSHHDDPHAPPGPHNLPKPDAAPSAPDTAQKPADASELLPAVSSHPRTGKRIDGATAAA
jgi:hypothetical protein